MRKKPPSIFSAGGHPVHVSPGAAPPAANAGGNSKGAHHPHQQHNGGGGAGGAITVVMVGPTGQGKSTLGNMLAGGRGGFAPFTTSDDFDSETLEASHADFAYNLQNFRAIDTIGFLDTRMGAAQNMDRFAGFADRAPGGIDVFLFVLKKGRFTEQSLGQIAAFRAVTGEQALRHMLLVFTHCGTESNDALLERCSSSTNQHLRAAMGSCAGVVGVDSCAPGRGGDRAAVLEAIREVVLANRGQKYDNQTLTDARIRREELQDRIIRNLHSPQRREAMEEKLDGLFHGRFTFTQVYHAVEDAIEHEEAERKAEEDRISMQALLAAAKSEAQAWKEVARNVLLAQNGGRSTGVLGSMAGCCGPPQPATYDACEVRYEEAGMNFGAGVGGGAAGGGVGRTPRRSVGPGGARPMSGVG